MPVTVEGAITTEQMLLRLDTTAKKRVMTVLIKRAIQIRDMARKMAPVDLGNLEEAIQARGTEEGRQRDENGRFQKKQVEVYIDMDHPVEDPHRKTPATVGQYAYFIHEHQTPAGLTPLGIKSQLKQAGQREVVGGAFMDRAVEAVLGDGGDEELMDILRDFM